MNPCPSLEQLRSLLDEQVTAADENRISAHIDACPACGKMWDAITGDFSESSAVCGQARSAPLPEFLKRLQERLPEELLTTELQDKSGCTSIQFPGPPTLLGKLGQLEHFHIRQELGHGATGMVFH